MQRSRLFTWSDTGAVRPMAMFRKAFHTDTDKLVSEESSWHPGVRGQKLLL